MCETPEALLSPAVYSAWVRRGHASWVSCVPRDGPEVENTPMLETTIDSLGGGNDLEMRGKRDDKRTSNVLWSYWQHLDKSKSQRHVETLMLRVWSGRCFKLSIDPCPFHVGGARQSWRHVWPDNSQCRSVCWFCPAEPRPSDVFANHHRSPNAHPKSPTRLQVFHPRSCKKLAEAVVTCHFCSSINTLRHLERRQTRRALSSATSSLTLLAPDYSLQIATGQSEMHFYSSTLLSSG